MRISQLKYFCSVVDNASFTAAAEKCHVAQPAISQQIRALEQELGFELLVRTSKGTQPTEAGAAYYREASNIIRLLDRAQKHAEAVSQGTTGLLRIGVASSSQAGLLEILNSFRFLYPQITIELKRARSAEIETQLEQNEYDILPAASSMVEPIPNIKKIACRTSRIVIGMSKTHPLASKDNPTVEDLCRYPHIIAKNVGETTLYETYPYLKEHSATPLLYAEDQGIGWLMMLMGAGLQAMPEEVAVSDTCVFRQIPGHYAVMGTCWACLDTNENPALPLFGRFLEKTI